MAIRRLATGTALEAEFAVLETHVPLDAQRLLRFACGFHGHLRTSRAQVPVKTAMEKEQRRDVERYTRTIGAIASRACERKFL